MFCTIKPLEFGGVARLIRSGLINWRPGKFCFQILMKESYERRVNHLQRLKDYWDGLVHLK
jgi:hypothetical protein